MNSQLTFSFKTEHEKIDEPAPVGYIFVDWGDRNEGPFFDHHDSKVTCSTALVNSNEGWKRLGDIVAKAANAGSPICVVTHASPDLDSVASACIVERATRGGTQLHPEVVHYVLSKDKGIEVGEDPVKSIALLFQALKNQCADDDVGIMQRGIALLEALDHAVRTCSFRPGWNDPSDLPGLSLDARAIQQAIRDARKQLRGLLARSPKLLLACPRADTGNRKSDTGKREFDWVDGCVLDLTQKKEEPLGWKEYVRHDIHGSLQGRGFGFMAVVATKRGRDNFTASLDPRFGMSLAGLGAQLDAAEARESKQLMQREDSWDERLRAVAAARAIGGKPTLLRDEASPRLGFGNSDPWYDGRGSAFTIVGTPESGSVLERRQVLCQILSLYDPLWQEMVEVSGASRYFLKTDKGSEKEDSKWLRAIACPWKVEKASCASTADVDREQPKQRMLADLITSIACPEPTSTFAVYAPVTQYPPQLLPQSKPLLHLHLALYLAMHGLPANSPRYPDLERLERWVAEFAWRLLPGVWCAVSERGAIMIDYISEQEDEEPEIFKSFRDSYFALHKQLAWTKTLSPTIMGVKRYEALLEFAKRSAIE